MSPINIVYGDVELLAVNFLRDQLPAYTDEDVVVGTHKPDSMPTGGVIQLILVGGAEVTPVSRATRLDVLCWHDSDKQAHDLAQLTNALCRLMVGAHAEGVIHRVADFVGPYRNYDPDSGQPRYRFTVEAVLRGQVLEPSGS